jgi:hypothetical protein
MTDDRYQMSDVRYQISNSQFLIPYSFEISCLPAGLFGGISWLILFLCLFFVPPQAELFISPCPQCLRGESFAIALEQTRQSVIKPKIKT